MYPRLFELRWKFEIPNGLSMLVRQYHGEPEFQSGVLVATHIHRKFVSGTPLEIQIHQNMEIEFAYERYVAAEWANSM